MTPAAFATESLDRRFFRHKGQHTQQGRQRQTILHRPITNSGSFGRAESVQFSVNRSPLSALRFRLSAFRFHLSHTRVAKRQHHGASVAFWHHRVAGTHQNTGFSGNIRVAGPPTLVLFDAQSAPPCSRLVHLLLFATDFCHTAHWSGPGFRSFHRSVSPETRIHVFGFPCNLFP